MSQITIIGGGLAGLTAAVACAEAGAEVVVHEAHATARRPGPHHRAPWLAHEGPHAFYADGPHWHWLVERDLVGPVAPLPLREVRGRPVPPRRAPPPDPAGEPAPLLAHRRRRAPGGPRLPHVGRARCMARRRRGPPRACSGSSPIDSDPGRLSAAFVWDLLLRFTAARAPAVRWPVGGWPVRGRAAGGACSGAGRPDETSSRVDVLPEPPVIVATQLESARALLGDGLAWESGRCVLLDVGLVAPRDDAFLVVDLDDAGFVERATGVDASLAPAGHRSCRPTCR